jgi:NH3-dependent NAD+ synthetase
VNTKLGDAYRQDRKPVLLLDPTADFNTFAGSVDVNGNAVSNFSGITLTNLSTAVCTTASPAVGCTTNVGAGGVINSTDYLTSVFAAFEKKIGTFCVTEQEPNPQEQLAFANSRARLRMMTLYQLAQSHGLTPQT